MLKLNYFLSSGISFGDRVCFRRVNDLLYVLKLSFKQGVEVSLFWLGEA